MIAKEIAEKLVKKYALLHRGENEQDWIDKDIVFDEIDKQCALIAVDEILRVAFFATDEIYNYYLEVKQEIEKL